MQSGDATAAGSEQVVPSRLTERGRRRNEGPCDAVPGRLYRRVFKTLLNAPVREFLLV